MKRIKNQQVTFIKIGLVLILSFNIKFLIGQPYYDTHVQNRFVNENSFLAQLADTTTPPNFNQIKEILPQPHWPARTDVVNCYWHTWQIAFANLKKVQPKSGFVSPFIDPAFNEHIFMWDCSFMTMFGKYGSRAFPFQGTLDNFYSHQHPDGFICREIRESDGTDFFERFDVSSTGPNLLPWAEWEYYLNFNDTIRLAKIFPALLAYYQWFHTYRSWPDGTYFSSGWGCGMDNQPRMPENCNQAWSHGHMSWIDITAQQVMAGSILIEMAQKLNRTNEIMEIKREIFNLTLFINQNMWDNQQQFYFDRMQNGSLSTVKSIASYWVLMAGIVPKNRQADFIEHLTDTTEFARLHRVATLSADHPKFSPDGDYWNGSVWAPTNYMVLRGLTKNGYDSLAYQIALNHLNNVVAVYTKTGDLRENYAPDKIQGNDRHQFVGWTGLVPISVLFEYVFGIRPDVPNNTLLMDVNLTDEYGVTKYPFGKTGSLDILVKKRKNVSVKPEIIIETNQPLNLKIQWPGGQIEKLLVLGKNRI